MFGKKKKRQPSFTMPKNPYKHRAPAPTDADDGRWVGTWSLMRSRKVCKEPPPPVRGIMNLNSKISAGLDPSEISTWLREQKVSDLLWLPSKVGDLLLDYQLSPDVVDEPGGRGMWMGDPV
jgi:hypothetical protein